MNDRHFIVSEIDDDIVWSYFRQGLSVSPIGKRIGETFFTEGSLHLVTRLVPRKNVDFSEDWGDSCGDWLIATIIEFLKLHSKNAILLEDSVSSPSDPGMTAQKRPIHWDYQETVFWPITSATITPNAVAETISWGAGMYILGWFVGLPNNLLLRNETKELTLAEFTAGTSSISRVVVSVFQGGGFLVWDRVR